MNNLVHCDPSILLTYFMYKVKFLQGTFNLLVHHPIDIKYKKKCIYNKRKGAHFCAPLCVLSLFALWRAEVKLFFFCLDGLEAHHDDFFTEIPYPHFAGALLFCPAVRNDNSIHCYLVSVIIRLTIA